MEDAYHQEKDKKIEILENTISSYQKLYDMAIDYIQDHWDTLYSELIAWNTEYGSVLNSEITEAWQNCQAAAERYRSFVDAMLGGIKNEIVAINAQIESLDVSSSSGASSSTVSTPSSTSSNVVGKTDNNRTSTNNERIHAIIKEMYANSQEHHTATKERKAWLSNRNLQLGAMLAQYGVNTHREDDGVWYMNGSKQLLYDKYRKYIYHNGGIAGDNPTLKQNEIMAVLEKGEAVLDEKKQQELHRLIKFATELSDEFSELVKTAGVSRILAGGEAIADAKSDVPSNISNNEVKIEIGPTYIYGTNEDTVEQHREVTRKFTNEILSQLKIKR